MDTAKGLIEGRVAPTTVDGQQVLDLYGTLLPVPTGDKPVQVLVSEDKVLTLRRLHDGSFKVKTRTLGLESKKKGKFEGTLLADDTGKLDIGGKRVDVSGMKPGETKTQKLKLDGKTFRVEIRMNADGTFHVEGKRKRGLFGSIANFVGNVFKTVMPVVGMASMLVPGMQWLGVASKVWGAIQGGIGAFKAFAGGNLLGGLAGMASAVVGGARALGANVFAAAAEQFTQTLTWVNSGVNAFKNGLSALGNGQLLTGLAGFAGAVFSGAKAFGAESLAVLADKVGRGLGMVQTGFNTLKNGFSALRGGDILGGLAGIASSLATGAALVGDWAKGKVLTAARKVGELFNKVSGSLLTVKGGAGLFKNGLEALKHGDLLGGLAAMVSGLATGAGVVGSWATGKLKEAAEGIASTLGKVARSLGLGDAALKTFKAGLQALKQGRLAEGLATVLNGLTTGLGAVSDWTRGQAARAVQNLAGLFTNVAAGAQRVQGLMDAVKSGNPSAILRAMASTLGFSAGVINDGAGATAALLKDISGWLNRAGGFAADPKAALEGMLVDLGARMIKQLISPQAPSSNSVPDPMRLGFGMQQPSLVASGDGAGVTNSWVHGVRTHHGNLRVELSERKYRASDTGTNHTLTVFKLNRADSLGGLPDGTEQARASDFAALVDTAARWLYSTATVRGLEGFWPETVQITMGDNGVVTMQKWMSNGSEGRLVSVGVHDPRNPNLAPRGNELVEVPAAVMNALPDGRGRDVTRAGGTQYNLRTALVDGKQKTFWEAFYLKRADDGVMEQVHVMFTPGDNQIGAVVHSRSNGEIRYDLRSGHEQVPVPRNNLPIFTGAKVLYFPGGAEVRNEKGTLRELYDQTGEGEYKLLLRTEHILRNQQSTGLRLIYQAQLGVYQLARVKDDASVEHLSDKLEVRDGRPVLPLGALGGMDPATLSAPLTLLAPAPARLVLTAGSAFQPRQVSLDYSQFRYTKVEGSAASRWMDPNAPWEDWTVVVNGKREQKRLLPPSVTGNANRYVSDQGVEYFGVTNGRELTVQNVNPSSAIGSPARAYTLPPGSFIVPSGGARAKDLIPQLAAMGLETMGVLGTGFIGSQDIDGDGKTSDEEQKKKNAVGYTYFDPRKLGITQNIPAADRVAGKNDQRSNGIWRPEGLIREDGLGSDEIHAGYYTTFSRDAQGNLSFQNHIIEFPDTPGTGKVDNDRAKIRKYADELAKRPDVVAINMFAHHSSDKVEELIGIMDGSEPDKGVENELDGEDGKPTSTLDARAMMVYDKNGQQLGVLFVPKMAIRDTLEAARQAYKGQEVQVQNMDGDFYAQAWFPEGGLGSSNYALGYQDAFIVVKPTPGFKPAKVSDILRDPTLDTQFSTGTKNDFDNDLRQRGIPEFLIPVVRPFVKK